jgi:nitroreductase
MKMTESQLRQILDKANWSPSGDNCQPWTYEWNGERLVIFHDAERGEHPVNPGGVASRIALGCLLEAMDISASEHGFNIRTTLLELRNEGITPWAEVRFEPSGTDRNPLLDSLLKRTTDRRPFQGGDLRADLFQKLESGAAKLHFLAKPAQEFVKFVAESEQLLTDHPHILPATMKWARLSAKHAQKTQDGLSWRNLGAKFWEVPMMPLIRDYRPFFLFARHTIAPQHRARVTKQLTSSAGVICVSISHKNNENIVTAGRLMMNAWLSLTQQGYGVQPLTLASMVNMCSIDGTMPLSEKWQKFHREGQNVLRKHLVISADSTPVWMIRAGISTPLPENCKTLRKPPQIKISSCS